MKFSSTVQQDEPTPAPIDNLHKLLMPEDAAQLQAISRQLWQIKHTLHVSHPNMTASITVESGRVSVKHKRTSTASVPDSEYRSPCFG